MNIDWSVPYMRSSFVQVVRDNDKAVIWHSLFGMPKVVSMEMLALLENFDKPKTLFSVCDEYEVSKDAKTGIEEMVAHRYLVPLGFDERAFLAEKMGERERTITDGSLIDYLELIMSEACNFRCTYCIHFNNLETSDRINNPKKFMRFEVAREIVNRYLNILREHKKNVAVINFGGGEPLIVWPVIEQILEYCVSTYGSEFTFRFTMNTNASLITRDIARKLKHYQVEVASSLDGLREGNDQIRLTKSGRGTFESIMVGFDSLAAEGYPLDGIAVTVNERNFPYLDEKIIDWAAERRMIEVRIDIDVIDMVEIPIQDIVARLMRVRRYAKERGIDVAGFWSRPAENLNDSPLDAHVSFCGAVRGNSMCVSPSGNIYGCGYSTTQLGTLGSIGEFHAPGSQYHRFVRDHLTGVMEMCKGCMIEGQCGGGCNITVEFARATNSDKIDRMCDFYRQMTKELVLEQLYELEPEQDQNVLIERR